MALSLTTAFSFSSLKLPSSATSPPCCTPPITTVHLSPFTKRTAPCSLTFSSSRCISSSGFGSSFLSNTHSSHVAASPSPKPFSLVVVAAKGYKMKTHKASAKRFRVTGSGKIMRRRAGKQHLLAKKNTKRKLRLSKMLQVDRSDYNNVLGALPYLKVNRQK